jgi:hypothetical protein
MRERPQGKSLADVLAEAAREATDPDVSAWLSALAAGDSYVSHSDTSASDMEEGSDA